MATHTTDFWPDDIGETGEPELRTPVALLREQAVALGEKTKNVVTAEVESGTDGDTFVHTLYLAAPSINYKYQLLTVRHPLLLYPLLAKEPSNISWKKLESEDDFLQWLKGVLASENTKKVIRALKAQSQGS
jgi:hypothetical protein